MSNMSEIVEHKIIFGDYDWDYKLRASDSATNGGYEVY